MAFSGLIGFFLRQEVVDPPVVAGEAAPVAEEDAAPLADLCGDDAAPPPLQELRGYRLEARLAEMSQIARETGAGGAIPWEGVTGIDFRSMNLTQEMLARFQPHEQVWLLGRLPEEQRVRAAAERLRHWVREGVIDTIWDDPVTQEGVDWILQIGQIRDITMPFILSLPQERRVEVYLRTFDQAKRSISHTWRRARPQAEVELIQAVCAHLAQTPEGQQRLREWFEENNSFRLHNVIAPLIGEPVVRGPGDWRRLGHRDYVEQLTEADYETLPLDYDSFRHLPLQFLPGIVARQQQPERRATGWLSLAQIYFRASEGLAVYPLESIAWDQIPLERLVTSPEINSEAILFAIHNRAGLSQEAKSEAFLRVMRREGRFVSSTYRGAREACEAAAFAIYRHLRDQEGGWDELRQLARRTRYLARFHAEEMRDLEGEALLDYLCAHGQEINFDGLRVNSFPLTRDSIGVFCHRIPQQLPHLIASLSEERQITAWLFYTELRYSKSATIGECIHPIPWERLPEEGLRDALQESAPATLIYVLSRREYASDQARAEAYLPAVRAAGGFPQGARGEESAACEAAATLIYNYLRESAAGQQELMQWIETAPPALVELILEAVDDEIARTYYQGLSEPAFNHLLQSMQRAPSKAPALAQFHRALRIDAFTPERMGTALERCLEEISWYSCPSRHVTIAMTPDEVAELYLCKTLAESPGLVSTLHRERLLALYRQLRESPHNIKEWVERIITPLPVVAGGASSSSAAASSSSFRLARDELLNLKQAIQNLHAVPTALLTGESDKKLWIFTYSLDSPLHPGWIRVEDTPQDWFASAGSLGAWFVYEPTTQGTFDQQMERACGERLGDVARKLCRAQALFGELPPPTAPPTKEETKQILAAAMSDDNKRLVSLCYDQLYPTTHPAGRLSDEEIEKVWEAGDDKVKQLLKTFLIKSLAIRSPEELLKEMERATRLDIWENMYICHWLFREHMEEILADPVYREWFERNEAAVDALKEFLCTPSLLNERL